MAIFLRIFVRINEIDVITMKLIFVRLEERVLTGRGL